MEWLVEFAYAAPDAIDVTALRERLSGEGVRGFIGVPMGKITGAEVVSLQRELRALLEATSTDDRSPTITTVTHTHLEKPPEGMPRQFASHHVAVAMGSWRDVVLAFACRLLSSGSGGSLSSCAVCHRAFVARRSTATICGGHACKLARNQANWRQWIGSAKGKRKRLASLEKRYEQEGWTLGARGGLARRKRRRTTSR